MIEVVGLERYVVFNVRISLYYSFQIRSIFHPVVYCQSSTAIAIRFGVNMLSDRSFMWLLDVAKVPSCLSHSCCCTAFAIWSKPTPTAKPAMLVKVMMMTSRRNAAWQRTPLLPKRCTAQHHRRCRRRIIRPSRILLANIQILLVFCETPSHRILAIPPEVVALG